MATIQATRVKKGMLVKMGEDLFRILDFQHVTPGNLRGFVRVKMRNIRNGALADNLQRIVATRLNELASFVPKALDPAEVKALHDMRIAAKRLRYILEVTGPLTLRGGENIDADNVVPITDAGELDMEAYERLLSDGKVGLVAITHMSNVLGTLNPIAEIASKLPAGR